MPDCEAPSQVTYQRHLKNGQDPCGRCKAAHNESVATWKRRVKNPRHAQDALSLWPGITAGHDARCSCSWAEMNGAYQVKVRNVMCVNHGGPLGAVLARMARWGVRGGD